MIARNFVQFNFIDWFECETRYSDGANLASTSHQVSVLEIYLIKKKCHERDLWWGWILEETALFLGGFQSTLDEETTGLMEAAILYNQDIIVF